MVQTPEYMVRRFEGVNDSDLERFMNAAAGDGWRLRATEGSRYIFERMPAPSPARVAQYEPQIQPQRFDQPLVAPMEFSRLSDLTNRERDIVELIATGYGNRAIAAQLGIKDQSVKNMVTTVMKKLGVENRTQLALRFHELAAGNAAV